MKEKKKNSDLVAGRPLYSNMNMVWDRPDSIGYGSSSPRES